MADTLRDKYKGMIPLISFECVKPHMHCYGQLENYKSNSLRPVDLRRIIHTLYHTMIAELCVSLLVLTASFTGELQHHVVPDRA